MLRTRVIPCLLLEDGGLVKTTKFKNPIYIGDPINSVRIYNELEVDELIFLDIKSSRNGAKPLFKIIKEIANECFMPFTYGGGVRSLDDVKRLFDLGVEKIAINTKALENPNFISQIANIYGNQSVVVSIDVKRHFFGTHVVYAYGGTKKTKYCPFDWAVKVESYGAGEILLNSISQDGLMNGFDLETISKVSHSVAIPTIALGGAGNLDDISLAKKAGASAIAIGSMAVYQNKNRGVLINFPTQSELQNVLNAG